MKTKDKVNLYVISSVVLALGVFVFLELFNIFSLGITKYWLGTLLLTVGFSVTVTEFITKCRTLVVLPTLCIVLGGMILVKDIFDLSFWRLSPVVILAVSSAFITESVVRRKSRTCMEIGIWGVALSVLLFLGSFWGLWELVLPIALVGVGIGLFIRTILSKEEKKYEIQSISIIERAEEIKKGKEAEK